MPITATDACLGYWTSLLARPRWLALLLPVAVGLWGCTPPAPPAPATTGTTTGSTAAEVGPGDSAASPELLIQQLAEFNRGCGLMEQYRYAPAAAAFEKVVAAFPNWQVARFNLGLAYLNLEGQAKNTDGQAKAATGADGKKMLDAARQAFETVLAADPDLLSARFVLGIYYQQVLDNAKALECFEAVYKRDSEDPYVALKYAETLDRAGRRDEFRQVLEKLVPLDPGFVSPVYRLAQIYQRSGQAEQAKPLFERFKQLQAAELDGKMFTIEDIYGSAGKYYRVLGADRLPLPRPEAKPVTRVLFSPQTKTIDTQFMPWDWAGGKVSVAGIAVGDVDGDGDLDICLTGCGEKGQTRLWLNDGSGQFQPGPVLADQGVSPCFGDFDNDGALGLWLGRAGNNLLFKNDGKGQLTALKDKALGGADALTSLARLIDIDSDGDLDFLAFGVSKGEIPSRVGAQAAASRVYINNRDGTQQEAAEALGLKLADTPVAAVVFDDFDNDRDLDLLIFPAGEGKPIAWVNDRVGKFHLLDAAATGLNIQHVLSATSGDFNKDGRQDLLVFSVDGLRLFVNRGGFRFEEDQEFTQRHGALKGSGGQFADLDNDGDLDIVIADAFRKDGQRGPVLLLNTWPNGGFVNANEADAGNLLNAIQTKGDASCAVADFTGDGKCDILLVPAGEKPLLIENATPGGHWIELDLKGISVPYNKHRSNGSAIGARVEIKTGAIWQQFVVGGNSGVAAASPLRIHAGLGENTKVEWLRILWPDAVLQAELELPADQRKEVAELQRKESSCPYLFAWDGTHFDFVADFGGVGGLGFWMAPGKYVPPDPTEYIRIPQLQPRDGQYVLQCVTPLEEVTYLDEVKLLAVDHPVGTEVYPNEMMAVNSPAPAFEVFCVRDRIQPVRAVDQRGVDVTDDLARIDRRCAGASRPDKRFMGLADQHFIELDFGDRLQKLQPDSRLILYLYGWVEYGYSSTMYAAHQAKLRTQAPSLEVWRDGRWVEVFHEVGYPAGLNHMLTLDVTGKVLPGDQRLRISTNMELYWDCAFLGEQVRDGVRAMRAAAPQTADLHFLGYPREYSPDGRQPNLADYDNLDRTITWKLMSGKYTRFGDVTELLQDADDCFVIMGHGEEVTLRFAADSFGPVPDGCTRTFLLKTDSFCKDMDLCTAHPDTVEPLPFHGMSGYPYQADEQYPQTPKTKDYQQRFNTRLIDGREALGPRPK